MARRTKVRWVDSTASPVTGCDGCELWNPKTNKGPCFAKQCASRWETGNPGYPDKFFPATMYTGRVHEAAGYGDLRGTDRPDKPWLNGMPRMVFLSKLGDAFSHNIPYDYLEREVIQAVTSKRGRRHLWVWLTRRPWRMVELCKELGWNWPENVIAGVSVNRQSGVRLLKDLLKMPAAKVVSVEPQLEPLQFGGMLEEVDWAIHGCLTGTGVKREMATEWAEQVLRQCRTTPYFLHSVPKDWPPELLIREVPELAS